MLWTKAKAARWRPVSGLISGSDLVDNTLSLVVTQSFGGVSSCTGLYEEDITHKRSNL